MFGKTFKQLCGDCQKTLSENSDKNKADQELNTVLRSAKEEIQKEIPLEERTEILSQALDLVELHDQKAHENKIGEVCDVLNSLNPLFSSVESPTHITDCLMALGKTPRRKESYMDSIIKLFTTFYSTIQRDQIREENRVQSLDRIYTKLSTRLASMTTTKVITSKHTYE